VVVSGGVEGRAREAGKCASLCSRLLHLKKNNTVRVYSTKNNMDATGRAHACSPPYLTDVSRC